MSRASSPSAAPLHVFPYCRVDGVLPGDVVIAIRDPKNIMAGILEGVSCIPEQRAQRLSGAIPIGRGGFRNFLPLSKPVSYSTRTNFCHKLRKVGQVFALNHETKRPCIEITLKQGWGKHTLELNEAFEQGRGTMIGQHWLDYDHVALAVPIIGLGIVELVAFGI